MIKNSLVISLVLLLGCSQNNKENQIVDYAKYSDCSVVTMYDHNQAVFKITKESIDSSGNYTELLEFAKVLNEVVAETIIASGGINPDRCGLMNPRTKGSAIANSFNKHNVYRKVEKIIQQINHSESKDVFNEHIKNFLTYYFLNERSFFATNKLDKMVYEVICKNLLHVEYQIYSILLVYFDRSTNNS